MSQQEIGAGIVGPQGVGADQLAQFSVDLGYDATKEYCGLSSLLEKLNSSTPVLVRVINNAGTNGHFMVVTGYDMLTETIYINDPALPENQEMSFNDFNAIWDIKTLPDGSNSSYLMLVIVPAEIR
jgi:Papain-like cysteine protease AvrRpt2